MSKLIENMTCLGLAVLLIIAVGGVVWLGFAIIDYAHATLGAL